MEGPLNLGELNNLELKILYSRNWQNVVNQLYSNIKKKIKQNTLEWRDISEGYEEGR